MLAFAVVVASSALAACSSDGVAPVAAAAADAGPSFTVPAAPCAAGSRASIGSSTCVPAGTLACAAGFERDASGWGCRAVLPAAACAGATRDALGSTTCVPVGDCAAAFPPTGAILVDPTLAQVDSTHVRSLAEALAAAAPGATIALADGTHTAPGATLDRDVSIIGRCAEKAHLAPAADVKTGFAVRARVAIRGLTLDGYEAALSVRAPGELTLADAVLEGSKYRAVLVDARGKAQLDRVVVRGTSPRTKSDQTVALIAGAGGSIVANDTSFSDNVDGAIVGTDGATTRIDVKRSVVRAMRQRDDGIGGGAVRAYEGAKVSITECALKDSFGFAVLALARKAEPDVVVLRSVVSDTRPTKETGRLSAVAVNAAHGATLRFEDSTLADTLGFGIYANDSGHIAVVNSVVVRTVESADQLGYGIATSREGVLTMEDSAVVDTGAVAASAYQKSTLSLSRSILLRTGGETKDGQPLGMGFSGSDGAQLDATDVTIVDARELAASVVNPGTKMTLDRVFMTVTPGAPRGTYAHALLAIDHAAVVMKGSIVEGHRVALFFAGAGGIAGSTLGRNNEIGVQTQEGSTLREAAAAPDAVSDAELIVVKDTAFEANATRVGSSDLPLPTVALPAP